MRSLLLLSFVVGSFSSTAMAAEAHSYLGLVMTKAVGGSGTLDTGTSINAKQSYGLSTRSFLYWTPSRGSATSYNLGISLGTNFSWGEITLSDPFGKSINLDTEFDYVGFGISNGVRFHLSRKSQVSFDLGLDLIPLKNTVTLDGGAGRTVEIDYLKTIAWHVQLASFFEVSRETDFAVGSRYDIMNCFDENGEKNQFRSGHINIGFRYKFVPDSQQVEIEDSRERRKVRRLSNRRGKKRYLVTVDN
jgi:hypothetical protein